MEETQVENSGALGKDGKIRLEDSGTFYKEDGHIRLQPENDSMDPIIVEDCQILGKAEEVDFK